MYIIHCKYPTDYQRYACRESEHKEDHASWNGKSILHARHKLRGSWICSQTVINIHSVINSHPFSHKHPFSLHLICTHSAFGLCPWTSHLQIRYKPHECVITFAFLLSFRILVLADQQAFIYSNKSIKTSNVNFMLVQQMLFLFWLDF